MKSIIFLLIIAFAFYFLTKKFGGITGLLNSLGEGSSDNKASHYKRRAFLFDAATELSLYKMLVELYGDKYYIFTQVGYSHLVEPKSTEYAEARKYRSSIDRKSADFVLCDKEKAVPQLVIELDGYVHNFKSRQTRDEFIDDISNITDLSLIHIKTSDLNKEYVKNEVDKKLGLAK